MGTPWRQLFAPSLLGAVAVSAALLLATTGGAMLAYAPRGSR
ncbi:MAG: hypothetical protein ACRDM1_10745 [Gaiellaceae bacterium]